MTHGLGRHDNPAQAGAREGAPGDLCDYVIDLSRELADLALEAGSPSAASLLILATAEMRKLRSG